MADESKNGPALASQPEFGSDDWFQSEAVYFHQNLSDEEKLSRRSQLESILEESKGSNNAAESEFVGRLLKSIDESGAGVPREERLARIEQYEAEIRDITVRKDRGNTGSYWGGLGASTKKEEDGPALVGPSGEREVPKPLLDPASRTGQTLTAFEVGIKRQVGDYFKKKDDAIQLQDDIYDHVYNQLSPAEQERMKAPKHWGWQYDSYKNMPFMDFMSALEKGGEFTRDDWKGLLGEELYDEMLMGDDPMTEEAGGFYRYFVQPWLSDGELKPSERLYQSVERSKRNWYSDDTRKSLDKPFVSKDAKWYKPWSWFDETTKAPWEDWDGFYYSVAENTPQLTSSIVSARTGGRLGSKLSALAKVDKAEDMITMQRRLSTAGGMIAGAGTEAMMIRDNVYAETSKRVKELPEEKWEENPQYMQLIGAGYSPELAKQVIGFEIGVKAGDTAMVVAGLLMGSPMSAFFGRKGAGQLGGEGSTFFSNMLKGTTGEGVQEGSQEAMEQFIGNLNVSYVDPEQSLTEGLGEAAAGGFFTSLGPGALGSIESGDQVSGFTDEQIKAIQASMDVRKVMADRYKLEKEVTSEDPGREKSPEQRVEDYQKLERMQRQEAETILENESRIKEYIKSQGGNDNEMKMLSRLVAKANMTLADIAVAEAKRTTAAQQLLEEQEIHKERVRIEEAVEQNLMKLEDIERQSAAIEAVQNLEAVPEEQYQELVKEGYGRWVGANQEKFVILPKGKRAQKEMTRQMANLKKQLDAGYTGPERRAGGGDLRRQMIDSASPEQREQMLYQDQLTGIQNRRAFTERAQDAPAVAAVDVDSLKWVNDNMGEHASGDRLLMKVANALRSQEGVEVYRLGGDEFAVTGESNEAVEAAMQAAAKKLQSMPIRNDRDEVIPTITWGKGATYEEADLEAAQRKRERAQSGRRAGRDKPPPSLRNIDQKTLFHENYNEEEQRQLEEFMSGEGTVGDLTDEQIRQALDYKLPSKWRQVQDDVEVGDEIEILTPDGAVTGVITDVKSQRKRPRLKVSVEGRNFTFNPEKNWLIVNQYTDPKDLAWLTGDKDYAREGRDSFPQTLSDITIGHIGADGYWIADLALDDLAFSSYPSQENWWADEYDYWNSAVPYVPFKAQAFRNATKDEMAAALHVVNQKVGDFYNLPPIQLVDSVESLEKIAPETVAEARTMGVSFSGVRGFFDETRPDNGIVLIIPNIPGKPGSDTFEMHLTETLMHELIGHFGVRGVFGQNNEELREYMHGLVDAFPEVESIIRPQVPRRKMTEDEHKQMVGEEMVAYITGEMISGKFQPKTKKQKNILQRFFSWIRSWMARRGWVTPDQQTAREKFWNDDRIRDLVARSTDYVRSGKMRQPNEKTFGQTARFMRDLDIFKSGVSMAIENATRTLSGSQRKQLAGKYGGKQNVPREVPMFDEIGSPNKFIDGIRKLKADNKLSARELELAKLDPDGEWNFFTDSTYRQVRRFMPFDEQDIEGDWYRQIMPPKLADEYEAAMKTARSKTSTPISAGQGITTNKALTEAASEKKIAAEQRLDEILNTKLDPKKSQLTKDMVLNYLQSDKVVRIYAQDIQRNPTLSYEEAARRVFGKQVNEEGFYDHLTEDQQQMIRDEIEATKRRGFDIGFDEELQEWVSRNTRYTQYAEYSPTGVDLDTYRVTYLVQEGGGLTMAQHGHFDHREGVIAHIRSGLATLQEFTDGPKIPNAPNPAMQGKALVMIELQSDWLQNMRKGFSSASDKIKSERDYQDATRLLNGVAEQFGADVSSSIQIHLREAVKSIANLPEGSLKSALESRIRDRYPDGATEDQKFDEYVQFRNIGLKDLSRKIMAAADGLTTYANEVRDKYSVSSLPTTADARAFERLDKLAASMIARPIADDLNNLAHNLDNIAQNVTANQVDFVEMLSSQINSSMRHIGRVMRDSYASFKYRIPVISNEIKNFLEPAFDSIGIDKAAIDSIISKTQQVMTASFRLPVIPVETLMKESGASVNKLTLTMLQAEIISTSALEHHGILPASLTFKFEESPSGDYEITVGGRADSIEKFRVALPKIFEEWAENNAPSVWNRMFASDIDKPFVNKTKPRRAPTVDHDYDWDTLVDEFNIEESDIDGDQDNDLDRYGIEAYHKWEEDGLTELRDDAVESYINHIDWSEVTNSDGESLARSGDEYRSRLDIDEDGDVDNSDAEEWLEEARSEYRMELYEDDTLMDAAYEQARNYFAQDPPMLFLGKLPTDWDENGDVIEHVEIAVLQRSRGDYAHIYIDNVDVADSYSTKDAAFDNVSEAIATYYAEQGITPPAGKLFSPTHSSEESDAKDQSPEAENLPEKEEGPVMPDFKDIAGAINAGTQELKLKPKKTPQLFNSMVTNKKKMDSEYGIYPDTPFAPDKFWRTAALKYLISDAVRRGIPSIIWHPGTASTSRGGWGPDWKPVERIGWSVEEMDIRGETQEVIVVTSPEHRSPIVLTWPSALRALGTDVIQHINRQISGELPSRPSENDTNNEAEPSEKDYLLSRADGWISIHYRMNNSLRGFFQTEEEVKEFIAKDIEKRSKVEMASSSIQPADGGGRVLHQGEVTKKALGGMINISIPAPNDGYIHTFGGGPRSSAARNSYEVITKKIWEQELQKYGASVAEHWIKTDDFTRSTKREGMISRPTGEREEKIRERFGHIDVKELTGDTHGWIVVSEKEGVIVDRVFSSRDDADNWRDSYINDIFGNDQGAVKVFYIEVNDKMREEFSGPVTPFHYDPMQDPNLKDAAEKIGYEPTSLRERFGSWRQLWKDHFNQGMFDRFHGIKRATNRAGLTPNAEVDPYIQARLTTSLDSVMKSVMEYGNPVWKEGIVQTEGRGLLDILQPVMEDIDLWGMYMAGVRAKRLFKEGRENLFTPEQIDAMVRLGDKYPVFKRVAAEYAAFNKKVLDFAEQSGVINKETRPLWENADYVPFYRVEDDRLTGPLAGGAGVVNQRSPIRRLKGGEANVGNIMHNILVNLTKLVDSSMKNHAALLAVDSLKDVGIISKKPMTHSQELIPLQQVKKMLIDRGMNPDLIPPDALTGMQKMFAIQPPEGEGVISVLRDGKKEFYYTDDVILYRALTAINKKAWGRWMNLLRAPKRLLTTLITLDPGFMMANYMRDSLSAFVLSRDNFIPIADGVKGFGKALIKDKDMRTMMSAGASFENGYINQYDPKATERLIKKAMKNKSFTRTLLTSPAKLFEAWKAIGSATENANRMAVYQAAIRSGKGKARAAYEAKDLMDFSMGGDWPFIQFLIQTVPFMGARMQGLHRLGRGAMENPAGFTIKGTLVGLAGLALWFAFKDDDRYKELEEWDKDVYFHFWIGENHYRLPKPFEVGALFNTMPERMMELAYSKENDAGKLFMNRFGFMIAETFNMNPVPQTFRPMAESYFNYNWFTGRSIVSPYEEQRMPPEQYRYTTSPTMVELARLLPEGLDTASTKIRSPLHLQNLYAGYTGTLGRYFMMASDSFLRQQLDYPLPPAKDISQYPVVGRFMRGDAPKRTKYEEEVYRLIDKTTAIQGSLAFLERSQLEDRMNEILEDQEPYIRVADSLEDIREDIRDINRSIMNIYMDPEMTPEDKKRELDMLQDQKNFLFKEGYELRPGGKANPVRSLTERDVIGLIDDFGVDDSQAYKRHLQENAPDTYELLEIISTNMEKRNILSLAKVSAGE